MSLYTHHIASTLGKMNLTEIKPIHIRRVINDLIREGLQFETQSKVRILLLDLFDRAIENGLAEKNPARGVKVVRDENRDPRVLTEEEQITFFEIAKGTFYENLFIVALHTGMRPGELFALTEQDLDFENKEIKVTKTLSYQRFEGDNQKVFHLGGPKTRSSNRNVPMTKRCEQVLRQQIELKNRVASKHVAHKIDGLTDLLFVTRYNTPLNCQIMSDAINRLINEINSTRAELEEMEPFSPYAFRHTYATRAFESGISPKVVQMNLGHSNIKTTMDIYTHVLNRHNIHEIQKLEQKLEKLEEATNQQINPNLEF